MAITQVEVGDLLTVKIQTGFAAISRIKQTLVDGVHDPAQDRFIEAKVVEATGPWSLQGLLSRVQAKALADNTALKAEVDAAKKTRDELIAERDTAKADKAAAEAAIKVANAELHALKNPPNLAPVGLLRRALKAIKAVDAWEAAVDATVDALATADDPDPKRIVAWWEAEQVTAINTIGPDWAVIVGAAKWPDGTSAAVLLAKIAELRDAGKPQADKPGKA